MKNSRVITTNQQGLHNNLDTVVKRHLNSAFLRPIPDYSLRVFEQANEWVQEHNGDIILDSYCGVGESTAAIAEQHPDALVIGIDKSLHRLNKHEENYSSTSGHYHLLQADVDDFWRLAVQAQWKPLKHYLLYPNPWPKSAHLKRRVHGSPLFPTILALGGTIELRSNWRTYVEEYQTALTVAGHNASLEPYQPAQAITPFERKYLASGQTLWRSCCQLDT